MVLPVRAKKIVLASVVVVTVLTLVNYHQIVHFAETALPHRLPEPFTHNHIFYEPSGGWLVGPAAPCPQRWIPGIWVSKSQRQHTGGVLPLTEDAQQEVFQAMNPPGCGGAKFLVHRVEPQGFAAAIHELGVALQLALDSGRVLVEAPGSPHAEGVPECGALRNTLDSCYLLPFSSCRPSEADIIAALNTTQSQPQGVTVPREPRIIFTNTAMVEAARHRAPKRFEERLQQTAVDHQKHRYWWRAQAAAYLLRPNMGTLANLGKRRMQELRGPEPSPGCITVIARSGKSGDGAAASDFKDADYDERAAKLRALDPTRFNDHIFLSASSGHTLSYFANGTGATADAGAHRWHTGYVAGLKHFGGGMSLRLRKAGGGHDLDAVPKDAVYESMLNTLLELDLALECSGFVGSIDSHWVRLVDEMRSVVRCSADAPYIDVGHDDPRQMNLHW
ncbi:hypothetical protein CHLRE_12g505900v5 [Chlamydomonas reinhardtii]|uniref:Uncharacterized protein n=1 Tax=Chlamydomonas reinhardtii TaxID=3055 RepID=A0A2K3D2Z0_CHLRE|nr:uncharacterized protein CHLRE_12g505900v5 [Chlamydomonas reinhardtii]PNW74889.1 hypothetical protein CHLRE_12g505900v5 [Chlamydomonas reinhardtii]